MKIAIYFGSVMNVTSRLFLDILLEKVITSDVQQDMANLDHIRKCKCGTQRSLKVQYAIASSDVGSDKKTPLLSWQERGTN